MPEVRIDVSRNWAADKIPGVLVLRSSYALTARDALARFRRSVSQWLANSEAGKAVWERSANDFNYGDFIHYSVADDPEFLRFLNANGLESAKVERYQAEDCGEHWDHSMTPEGE